MRNPFRYFNSPPEVIRLVVMMYGRFPLSLRQIENLLHEQGIDICYETGRWLNNRAENLHQPFRRRERAMAKFRTSKSLQKFASIHTSVHNHSIRNAISTAAKPSKSIVQPLWLSGGNLRPEDRYMSWSHIVGQLGSAVKVYSGSRSCCQNRVYHILLLLLSLWGCG